MFLKFFDLHIVHCLITLNTLLPGLMRIPSWMPRPLWMLIIFIKANPSIPLLGQKGLTPYIIPFIFSSICDRLYQTSSPFLDLQIANYRDQFF